MTAGMAVLMPCMPWSTSSGGMSLGNASLSSCSQWSSPLYLNRIEPSGPILPFWLFLWIVA
jgi:hypothetical protein